MRDWSNLDDRFDVWKVVERRDGSKELNSKTSKVYEIMTILAMEYFARQKVVYRLFPENHYHQTHTELVPI